MLKGLVGVSAEIKAPDLDVYEENEFAEFEDQDDDQEQINNIKLDKQDSSMLIIFILSHCWVKTVI